MVVAAIIFVTHKATVSFCEGSLHFRTYLSSSRIVICLWILLHPSARGKEKREEERGSVNSRLISHARVTHFVEEEGNLVFLSRLLDKVTKYLNVHCPIFVEY